MNSESPHRELELELAFQERIDILFHEIELAVKWDRPSILFAIYKTESVRDEVNAVLNEKLKSIHQETRCIKTEQFDFVSEISQLHDLARTVLLIDGFHWECGRDGVHVLTEFNKHREYFIDNNIRAIFWLYEEEVSDFAENATECWMLRHRVVDFEAETQASPRLEPSSAQVEPAAGDAVEEEIPTDLPIEQIEDMAKNNQADASHANKLLSLGILGWRKGNPQGALKYLRLASGIAKFLGNHSLQAQCQNALALANAEVGDIDAAVTAYETAIALSPESGFLWNNLAQLLARNERNEEAILAYQKALAYAPQDFLGWDGVGQVYLRLGLHQNAIAAFEKATSIAPYYEFSWHGAGQAYLESGQFEKATISLEKAVKLNPQLVDAWKTLGRCYTRWERIREALTVYQRAIELNPQEACLWSELGRLYLQKQDYVEGISAFQKVVSLRPDCSRAKIELAFAYSQIGDYETSAAIYEDNIPLFEEKAARSKLLNMLGDIYMHLKEYEKAIASYEQADQLFIGVDTPKTVEPSVESELQDDEAEVEQEMEQEMETDASHEMDVEVEQEMEQTEPVEERGEDMNEANQVFDMRSAEQWNELGNVHLKEGAYNDAITAYTKAIELAGDSSWPYIQNLAHVHYQKGKVKGKLTADKTEDPDLWEDDDDSGITDLFDLDAIPTPERADSAEVPGVDALIDMEPAAQVENPAGAGEIASNASPSGTCCLASETEPAEESMQGMENAVTEPAALDALLSQETNTRVMDASAPAPVSLDGMPKNSIDWNEMGNSLTRSRKFNEAIAAYKKAIEMNPRYGQPYCNLGLLYYHLGQFDTAVLLFKKSLELLETNEERSISWNKLGDSYRRLGDYGNALAAYQRSSEITPTVSPVMARARAALLQNTVVG